MRKLITAPDAPTAIGPYSHAVQVGNLLYTSGQIPLDAESGKKVEGGIEAETRQVLKNLIAVLEAGGSDASKVVKTTVFLTDLGNFAAVNAIYGEVFGDSPPARSCIEVCALPAGSLVEIEAIALVS